MKVWESSVILCQSRAPGSVGDGACRAMKKVIGLIEPRITAMRAKPANRRWSE